MNTHVTPSMLEAAKAHKARHALWASKALERGTLALPSSEPEEAEIERVEPLPSSHPMFIGPRMGIRKATWVSAEHHISARKRKGYWKHHTFDRLIKRVSEATGYSKSELLGPRRPQGILRARQTAIALFYKYSFVSLPQIGRLFNRDHSTVLNAVRRYNTHRAQWRKEERPNCPE